MPGSRAKHACVTPTGGYFFEETTATSLVKVRFGEGTPPEGMLVGSDGTETVAKADVVNIGCVPVGRGAAPQQEAEIPEGSRPATGGARGNAPPTRTADTSG